MPQVQPQALDCLVCPPRSYAPSCLQRLPICCWWNIALLWFEHVLGYPHTYLSHFCLNDESQTTDLTPNLLLPLSSIPTSLNGYLNLPVTYTDSVGHLRSSLHDLATFKHL